MSAARQTPLQQACAEPCRSAQSLPRTRYRVSTRYRGERKRPAGRPAAALTRRRAAWALPPLLLAFALIALAVFFAGDAPPAQAQSGPAISFESSAYVVPEIDGQVTIFLNASAAATSGINVTVTASGGAATAGSDYTGTSWTPSILSGGTTSLFSIPITKDDSYGEGAETFTLTISAGTGYTVGTQGTATVTILDSPPGAIWQARLTVQLLSSTLFGCTSGSSTQAKNCDTPTTLSSNSFNLDGTTYTVAGIDVGTSAANFLSFGISSTLPEAIQDYTLQVGNAQFPFGRATTSSDGQREDWRNSGLTWAAGDVVDLVLLESVGWERSECDRIRTLNNTPTPPGRPSGVNAINIEATSAVLEWDPSATTPDGGSVTNYIVYVYPADETLRSARAWDFKGHENAATTYSETITGLEANTTYEARVRARTILGCRTGLSVPVTFTTPSSGSGATENPPGRLPNPQQPQPQPPAQQPTPQPTPQPQASGQPTPPPQPTPQPQASGQREPKTPAELLSDELDRQIEGEITAAEYKEYQQKIRTCHPSVAEKVIGC